MFILHQQPFSRAVALQEAFERTFECKIFANLIRRRLCLCTLQKIKINKFLARSFYFLFNYFTFILLQFVAHPHCQQLLASIWFEGLPGFRRQHIAYRILMICTIGLLAPLWAVLYLLAPKSVFGNLMRKPFIKFIVHSASYIIFLCK